MLFLLLEGRAAVGPKRAASARRNSARIRRPASGYWTTRDEADRELNARTSGIYWRADPEDLSVMDGRDDKKRAALIAERLEQWKSAANG